MTPPEFYIAVKSTIDYIGHQIAQNVRAKLPAASDLKAFTLDATTGVVEELTSSDPAIVWTLNNFAASPVDPLYKLTFLIGPKTTADVSGELMAVLLGEVQTYLPDKSTFKIKNYSKQVVSEGPGETGKGFVISSSVQEQAYDNQSALRMIVIVVAVSRDMS